MRGRGNLLPGLLAAAVAVLAVLVSIPVNVVSNYFPADVTGHRLAWFLGLLGGLVVIGMTAWLAAQPPRFRPGRQLLGVAPVSGWVDREELAELVTALTAAGGTTVALTTGLTGAGGFGKTTLAARACQDQRVVQWFRDGIVWVPVGRDIDGAALAARLSEIITGVGGDGPPFTSLEQAGRALAEALAGRKRMLLVVDDVWTASQMRPFAIAARSCQLLVTTRRPTVLRDMTVRKIKVDALPPEAARRLLVRDLPKPMSGLLEAELAGLTGGWPLLLSLVNRRLVDDVQRGADIDIAAGAAARRLRIGGPAALDVTDSEMREDAVSATIGYSLERLDAAERERFSELGIFAEDAEVPVAMAASLWRGTARLDEASSESLCDRLDGLSLLTLAWVGPSRVFVLHDVVRDYALHQLGVSKQAAAHAALLSTARLAAGPGGASPGDANPRTGQAQTEWWRLSEAADYGYLWEHLTYHMQAGGLESDLNQVCTDLRFLATRLERSGPAAVEADLARSGSPLAARLRRVVAQEAHLFSPLKPPGALTTTFTSRLSDCPTLADQLPALRSSLRAWTAWPAWPPPDLPSDMLLRTINGHRDTVTAVAIAPDGTWLATGGLDTITRTWDADGTPRAVLISQFSLVLAVAIAPDGTWLAIAGSDGTIRIRNADGTPRAALISNDGVWGVAIAPDGSWLATVGERTIQTWDADGTPRAVLTGHQGPVNAVAIAPDGTWLATAGDDETARTWDADGTPRAVLTGHQGMVRAVAIAPDGTWLATAGDDTTRTWETDGTPRAGLTDHHRTVTAVAIAPDGTWLATGSVDGTTQVWDAVGVSPMVTRAGRPGPVTAVAIAPDGTWLATAGDDETARIWDTDGTPRAVLTGHHRTVRAVAIAPDGTWLATGSVDGTVRTWDAAGIPQIVTLRPGSAILAVAVAPDGTWFATGSADRTIRIWDTDGTPRAVLTGHQGPVWAVAIAPDGTWLATAGDDGTTRTWDADGTPRAVLTGHHRTVRAVAIAPDGTWLATAGQDETARTWDTDGTPRAVLTGHRGRVNAIAITPDGTWLATTGDDRTTRVWSADGTPQSGVVRVDGSISGCAWSPDGGELYLGGSRGLYRFAVRPPDE